MEKQIPIIRFPTHSASRIPIYHQWLVVIGLQESPRDEDCGVLRFSEIRTDEGIYFLCTHHDKCVPRSKFVSGSVYRTFLVM
jgi:hypothetical protein